MPTKLATRTTDVNLFYHFCVLVSDTVQLVPVLVYDDKSVMDFGFLHLFSALSDLIFPHFAPWDDLHLLTAFMKLFPKLSAHQVLFQLTMIVNVVPQLVRSGTPWLFFFYYFDHLLVYSILIPSFDFYCPKSIKCKLYISFIDHSLLFIH